MLSGGMSPILDVPAEEKIVGLKVKLDALQWKKKRAEAVEAMMMRIDFVNLEKWILQLVHEILVVELEVESS